MASSALTCVPCIRPLTRYRHGAVVYRWAREGESVYALLRQLRERAGLRQTDLAEQLGEHQSYVSRYEGGARRLDVMEVRRVCLALGTTLPAFVDELERLLDTPPT